MDPFVAEIRIFPFNFAPKGWAFCNGQIMAISQNTALFSLLGTTYGGDGRSTFGLPDMQGRAPMQPGQGPGLSLHDLGETGGEETVQLLSSETPSHNHSLMAYTGDPGDTRTPSSSTAIAPTSPGNLYTAPSGAAQAMNGAAVSLSGGDQPHNNMMPYLTLNFCIALQGVFPPRG